VPGEHEAIEPGKRRYNWVWYRNAGIRPPAKILHDRAALSVAAGNGGSPMTTDCASVLWIQCGVSLGRL
jgi:hypothetical protein